jgi:hypothetical protein
MQDLHRLSSSIRLCKFEMLDLGQEAQNETK